MYKLTAEQIEYLYRIIYTTEKHVIDLTHKIDILKYNRIQLINNILINPHHSFAQMEFSAAQYCESLNQPAL